MIRACWPLIHTLLVAVLTIEGAVAHLAHHGCHDSHRHPANVACEHVDKGACGQSGSSTTDSELTLEEADGVRAATFCLACSYFGQRVFFTNLSNEDTSDEAVSALVAALDQPSLVAWYSPDRARGPPRMC
ncbi:MAG: hypothetical protein QGF59_17900 [Pirellulaceae bacterium]|jgi:hypothetical protein|nr:hypothetical protein [Pirellulaceae bacterium]